MIGRMSPHGKGHRPASPVIFPSCETTAHPPVAAGGTREGKDIDDTDAQTARYQEARQAGRTPCRDSAQAPRGPFHGREVRAHGGLHPQAAGGPQIRFEDLSFVK